MAALVDGELQNGMAVDSRNQLPALLGEDKKGRDYVVEVAQTISVSDGEWKYITPCNRTPYYEITRTETGNSSEEQLYNLHEDIGEKNNVASKYPNMVKVMQEVLEREKEKGFMLK